MNLYEKLHFLKNKDPCPTIGHKDQTERKRTAKWEIRITEYVLSWPLGQHWDFKQFFFLDLNVSTNIPTAKRIIRNQIYFVFVIRNIGLRCKDGKWNSWILLNQLLNHNFWQILVIMYIGPQHKKGLTFKL